MKIVAQLCPALCDPLDCSLPGSSVHGILQPILGVGCNFLGLGIFQTQGSNLGLPHWRQILYHLSHQGKSHVNIISSKNPKSHQYIFYIKHGNTLRYDSSLGKTPLHLSIKLEIFYFHNKTVGETQTLSFWNVEIGRNKGITSSKQVRNPSRKIPLTFKTWK